MKLDNDNIELYTKFDGNEFTISVTQETDFSYDGGHSFEELTNSGTIDLIEAMLLIAELQEFVSQDPYTVDATHTDPAEIETDAVLKWKQRARAAEEALKEIMTYTKLGIGSISRTRGIAGKSLKEYKDIK
jgi:hypothetical protein